MSDVYLHIDDFLKLNYLKEKLDTNDVIINTDKSYNEYETQQKRYIFDPKETGTFKLKYNSKTVSVHVYDISHNGGHLETINIDSEEYIVCSFTDTGNHSLTISGKANIDLLVIGGGGGGGSNRGGGGGSGELILKQNYKIPSGTYNVVVGDGGLGGDNKNNGKNGENSIFGSYTADGGGGGGAAYNTGNNGGSGGGGGCHRNEGGDSTADTGIGNSGGFGKKNYGNVGSSAGGGGSQSKGVAPDGTDGTLYTAPNGGDGTDLSNIFGTQFGKNGSFAGGGGGGTEGNNSATNNTDYIRPRGQDGGGDGGFIEYDSTVSPSGSSYNEMDGTDALDNTGSGGGGGDYSGVTVTKGGKGASGIVLIRLLSGMSVTNN